MAELIDREALLKKLYEDCRCMNTHFLNAVRFAPSVDPDADTYYTAGIKVCPFCEDGGRMSMIETANGQHYVQCDKCGASRKKILKESDQNANGSACTGHRNRDRHHRHDGSARKQKELTA